MDILNWVYLIKNKFTRTTVENPATDLVVLGADVSYQKRGDKYQNYVMTVEDFAASIVPAPPYKVYTALVQPNGTNAPIVTEVENTIGPITWSYYAEGIIKAGSSSLFTSNKTIIFNQSNVTYGAGYQLNILFGHKDSGQILFKTTNTNTLPIDAIATIPFSVEIRVYN